MTVTTARRPRARIVAALAGVTLSLAMAACSSESVSSAAGSSAPAEAASPSSSAGGQFAAILPAGDPVAFSKDLVQKSLSASEGFTPPSTGPKSQKPGATIAFVAGDLSNGGHNSTSKAVTEAATVIGWKVSVYDGKGNAQGNSDAMNQAITAKPAAIILGGLDPTEQAPAIKQATEAGIPVIGWHAGVLTGPGNGMVTNVSTDPLKVSQLAAAYAVADSNGTAGVAIFTDGQYELAVTKARALEAYVQACTGCSVLTFEDSPIATADQRMPGLVSNLLQQNGDKLSYLLAINGNYFGGAARALEDAGKPKDGPPKSVAAGDGDAAELQRIRTSNYQAATVAEPITLQGWQLVDEVNRKLAGEDPSGFVAAPGLITKENVPSGDVFDPSSGFRDVYKQVWGK
ncbi:substrate-binding domain-containing protein [Microlunatus spumicola]|uniref:Substrate-binding domain-containing protein n=1 Tax=Microlunatus spumicola TaxID=81499 RepID=A0ABP6WK15_9ACTN